MRFDILRCLLLRQIQKYIQTGRKVIGSDGDDTYVIDILEELFWKDERDKLFKSRLKNNREYENIVRRNAEPFVINELCSI